jgi:hypothetical protein
MIAIGLAPLLIPALLTLPGPHDPMENCEFNITIRADLGCSVDASPEVSGGPGLAPWPHRFNMDLNPNNREQIVKITIDGRTLNFPGRQDFFRIVELGLVANDGSESTVSVEISKGPEATPRLRLVQQGGGSLQASQPIIRSLPSGFAPCHLLQLRWTPSSGTDGQGFMEAWLLPHVCDDYENVQVSGAPQQVLVVKGQPLRYSLGSIDYTGAITSEQTLGIARLIHFRPILLQPQP